MKKTEEPDLMVWREHEEVYEQSLEGICEEYGFDIKPQRDDTPVEVQFHGVTKIMPKCKAIEFAFKLGKLGFAPIINEAICTQFLNK